VRHGGPPTPFVRLEWRRHASPREFIFSACRIDAFCHGRRANRSYLGVVSSDSRGLMLLLDTRAPPAGKSRAVASSSWYPAQGTPHLGKQYVMHRAGLIGPARGSHDRYALSPYRRMKMSLRITLAAAALGTLLVSPGYARDVSDAQGHVRSSAQERSYTASPYARDVVYEGAQYFRQCSDSPARC
jgi:hypothetical protein